MTQLSQARKGVVTKEMEFCARRERVEPSLIRDEVAAGRAVIPANPAHVNLEPIVIGKKFQTKINANLGTSRDKVDLKEEIGKTLASIRYGADAVMDLSTGGDLDYVRAELIRNSTATFGTVPIYQAVADIKDVFSLDIGVMLEVIERQARLGVDFVTLHCGVTQATLPLLKGRITGIVSRGGSFLAAWMKYHDRENMLYEHFDEILDICREHDVTISLGDGLRPGCLHDAGDAAQYHELRTLGELTLRAWEKDVQVMIEGPGHVPIDKIRENMELEEEVCHGAPFYVLGPLVTDIAPGYDHITGAMGGLIAAYHGAAMLCYVTPKEHLGLPDMDDVRQGVIAFKIAAHAADIGRGLPGARERDDELSKARKDLNWGRQFQLALDPDTAKSYYQENQPESKACSMCADLCSMQIMNVVDRKDEEGTLRGEVDLEFYKHGDKQKKLTV